MTRVLVFLTILLVSPQSIAENIYIVSGDLTQTDQLNRPYTAINPLLPRTHWDRIKGITMFNPGTAQYYGQGHMFFENGQLRRYGYKDISSVFRKLKEKGYSIKVISKVDAKALLNIVADPETTAVFYTGHSLALVPDPDAIVKNIDPEQVYLMVYEGGKPVPLTEDVISAAKARLQKEYKAGDNLKLFFTGSCYADYCEAGIRKNFGLSKNVEYIAPAGKEAGSNLDIAKAFASRIADWADRLPRASKVKSRLSTPDCDIKLVDRLKQLLKRR